jgi:hypothetical protein
VYDIIPTAFAEPPNENNTLPYITLDVVLEYKYDVIYRFELVFINATLPYWVDCEILLVNAPLLVDNSITNLVNVPFPVHVYATVKFIIYVPPAGRVTETICAIELLVNVVDADMTEVVPPNCPVVGTAEYEVGRVTRPLVVNPGNTLVPVNVLFAFNAATPDIDIKTLDKSTPEVVR